MHIQDVRKVYFGMHGLWVSARSNDTCRNRTVPFTFQYTSTLCTASLKIKDFSIWVDPSNNAHQEYSHLWITMLPPPLFPYTLFIHTYAYKYIWSYFHSYRLCAQSHSYDGYIYHIQSKWDAVLKSIFSYDWWKVSSFKKWEYISIRCFTSKTWAL